MFLDLIFEPSYEAVIETMCRHLFRYLYAALLLSKNQDKVQILMEFVKRITHKYNDEFTDLILVLTDSFEFDKVGELLKKIHTECENDYFLHVYTENIMNESKALVLQIYTKVFASINTDYLIKMIDLPSEKCLELAQSAIKENGMKAIISPDKKNIKLELAESNMSAVIAKDGKELEMRTRKLQEKLQPNVSKESAQ